MKIFLITLTLIIAVQAWTEEQKKKIDEITAVCMEESKVDKKIVEDAIKGIFSEDPKLKVQAYCFLKKINFQNEQGEIQEDYIKAKLIPQMKSEEEVTKIMKKCIIRKETPELTGFEMIKCFKQNLSNDVSVV